MSAAKGAKNLAVYRFQSTVLRLVFIGALASECCRYKVHYVVSFPYTINWRERVPGYIVFGILPLSYFSSSRKRRRVVTFTGIYTADVPNAKHTKNRACKLTEERKHTEAVAWHHITHQALAARSDIRKEASARHTVAAVRSRPSEGSIFSAQASGSEG